MCASRDRRVLVVNIKWMNFLFVEYIKNVLENALTRHCSGQAAECGVSDQI